MGESEIPSDLSLCGQFQADAAIDESACRQDTDMKQLMSYEKAHTHTISVFNSPNICFSCQWWLLGCSY